MSMINACPYCGSDVSESDVERIERDGLSLFAVECPPRYKGCGARGPLSTSAARAVLSWNGYATYGDAPNGYLWTADKSLNREGAILGIQANHGDGGTVLYICDTFGTPEARLRVAERLAYLWNNQEHDVVG